MELENKRKTLLDQLIGMPKLLNYPQIKALDDNSFPKPFIIDITRFELQKLRDRILAANEADLQQINIDPDLLAHKIANRIRFQFKPSVAQAINAAGIILHTALGRAPLCQEAQDAIASAIKNYCTLAIDRQTGKRGDRYAHVEELLCYLAGAESAMVVNNNAGATMLVLNSMAFGREVIISRGQLIEIGGSFRIPDIMKRSGALMVDVGTTNKTHLYDYERAISENTALLLRVHTSNYQIIGFTSEVPLKQLVDLGHEHNLPVVDDIGSGCLIDFQKYGLPPEPMVQDSIKAGADIVTFSGDKILGGPQSGIIIGKKKYIDPIKKNPLTRALRCDKLTYAALEATLKLYLNEEHLAERHPVLKMLTIPTKKLANRCRTFQRHLKDALAGKCEVKISDGYSQLGSGSLPAQYLPTKLISLKPQSMSADSLAANLRENEPPIFARITDDEVLLDFRTIREDETKTIENAIKVIFSGE
ncbi:L-seryl-tRNA(Sec) selenium transferase [candidate division KSB1 bacterium]|nr:L-seryl-tRNA(Sec) selenium transferase [candidate division KSB1 bacterium]